LEGEESPLRKGKFAIIAITIGTNNLEDTLATPESLSASIIKVMQIIKQSQPQTKIFLHSILPREDHKKKYSDKKVGPINEKLTQLHSVENGIIYIDLKSHLCKEGSNEYKNISFLDEDKLHLSSLGYSEWYKIMYFN